MPKRTIQSVAVRPKGLKRLDRETLAIDQALRVIYRVCCLAGSASLIDEIRAELRTEGVRAGVRLRQTEALFDWLIDALSYQGISDQVAYHYMERHGRVTWREIQENVSSGASCPKLKSYWHFQGCRYDKLSRTCAEPDHIELCPLPGHDLRNGRLNQTAYGLFLFVRDIADDDFVGWMDGQLRAANKPGDPDRIVRMRDALIDPLKEIYGISDKMLTMTLSCILLGAPAKLKYWIEVGASMIAIDTLVHNFLHRTGILRRFKAHHAYGPACYQAGGCADIIRAVADRIDAREFNPSFPKAFPRFVQHAIWRYCSQNGLDVCNGNRIDDRKSCRNLYCQIYSICAHIRCTH
jgi:hypothetical protein